MMVNGKIVQPKFMANDVVRGGPSCWFGQSIQYQRVYLLSKVDSCDIIL